MKTLTRGKKPDKNKQAVPNFYYRAEYISQQCGSFSFLLIQPIVSYIPQKTAEWLFTSRKLHPLNVGAPEGDLSQQPEAC